MNIKFSNVKYPDTLDLRYVRDDEWILLKEFHCYFDETFPDGYTRQVTITVPAGFLNDLASVPQIFTNIIPVVGPQNLPSVIHDWCYDTRWRTREECDMLFLEGLKALEVPFIRRNLMYTAVRIGGGHAWET